MGITGSHARLVEQERERARAELMRRKQEKLAAELPPLPAEGDDSPEARRALMARCDRPDATAEDVAALRSLLARNRAISASVTPLEQALAAELERIGRALKREIVRDNLLQRRAELGYDTAPALEKPLILHLLLCELRLGNAEIWHTAADAMPGGVTIAQADHAERRLSAAQRRYLQAVEALAKIRRVRVELMKIAPDGSAEAVAVEGPGA